MKEYKERAEYYRIGLLTGLFSVADVVGWADTEIVKAEKPQYIFFELSLMGRAMPHDVCSKLGEFPGDVDKFEIIRKVLADMYSSLRVNPRYGHIFARGLYQLYADCDFQVPEDLQDISYLDEVPQRYLLWGFLKRFSKDADRAG